MAMERKGQQGKKMDYQKVGIWKLRELARQSHEQHDPDAARVFVTRILDIEAERRTVHIHQNLGWHSANPLASIGEGPGSTAIAREPLATMYDRGIYTHEQHELARKWIEAAKVPPRQLLAALIHAAKLHPRAVSNTPWAKSYDHIAEHLDWYSKALGFAAVPNQKARVVVREVQPKHRNSMHVWPMPEDRVNAELARLEAAGKARTIEEHQVELIPVYKDGEALRQAGKFARVAMIALAKI
uniref:hypothetical protein n=1 Tax=Halomonas sp. TaxID=1486246 RepID=UPI002619F7D5|nr:hypothetical protein [Halomonas sp.]